MNTKKALTILIEHSFSLPDETKLELLDQVEGMTDEQVNNLGEYLAHERQFTLAHETAIRQGAQVFLDELSKNKSSGGE